ncbi:glutamate receptor 4-like [Lineus longissimus]|uniref:glutamate receptor 4-like n=1 Tax=Lineus longissimus TaxID=88925 RepID=UPI002B4E7CE2
MEFIEGLLLFVSLLGVSGMGDGSADVQDLKVLKVTSILSAPFLMKSSDPKNILEGNDRYSGYIKDLLDMITGHLNINYTIQLVADGRYGALQAGNGTMIWNGMVRELIKGRADVAASDLTMSYMRRQVVDFTTPYMSLGIVLLMNKRDVTSMVEDGIGDIFFLRPFSYSVWVCLVVAAVVITALFYLINRFDPYEERSRGEAPEESGVLGSLWLVAGGLTLQGSSKRPRSAAAFVLSAIWWSFSIIFLATYIMALVSTQARVMFAVPSLKVRALDDLLKQPHMTVGCISGGSTMNFFRTSKIPIYLRIWDKMEKDVGSFVNTTSVAIQRVRKGGYAYLGESTLVDYAVRHSCDLVKVGGHLDSKSFALATPKGSAYTRPISNVLTKLNEDGSLTMLKTKWWRSLVVCQDGFEIVPDMFHPSDSPQFRSRDTIDLSVARCNFIYLLFGVCLALVTLAIEVLVFRNKRQPPADELKRELTESGTNTTA